MVQGAAESPGKAARQARGLPVSTTGAGVLDEIRRCALWRAMVNLMAVVWVQDDDDEAPDPGDRGKKYMYGPTGFKVRSTGVCIHDGVEVYGSRRYSAGHSLRLHRTSAAHTVA